MSVGLAPPGREAGLAPAARLIAAWWSRPTADERGRWDAAWNLGSEVAEALGRRPAAVDELRDACRAVAKEALLEEHERLLVGPGRVPCAPYESLWRTDVPRREQGRLMGASAADVVRLYGQLGLGVRADAHELPDHLVVEWEALGYAYEHGSDVAKELVRDHLALWVPAFCDAVAAETEQPFYAALAPLTSEWTAALAA